MLAAQIGDRDPSLRFLQDRDDQRFREAAALQVLVFEMGQNKRQAGLEQFRVSPNRGTAPSLCFIAFYSREPVSTSLENALESGGDVTGLALPPRPVSPRPAYQNRSA